MIASLAVESPLVAVVETDLMVVLRSSLNRSLRGKRGVVDLILASLLARGHLLIEDLPGLGKTTLA